MASTSETGHAKNVANFEDLIAVVTGYGPTYNPSKVGLKLPALTALRTAALANLADVTTKNTAFNNATNARQAAFGGLRSLSTRLVNALDATDAIPAKIEDAKMYNKKIQGKRSSSTAETPSEPNAPAPSTISASQQSYDQLVEHFNGLISVLSSEPTYTPNETDLKAVNLNSKKADLASKNSAVATSYVTVSNARIARNNTLYNDLTGLVNVAAEVKQYVKSLYGSNSAEYGLIKGIKFTKSMT